MAPANKNQKGKTPRKMTRRSPRTRILEELVAIKAMGAKHCVSDARHPAVPVTAVAPVVTTALNSANALVQMPLPQATTMSEKMMVPVVQKKAVSCPGGPKAYNEFIKQFRAENPGMNYQTALKNGAKAWYAKCGLPQPVKKNKTNKNKNKNKPKAKTPAVSRKVKKTTGALVVPSGFQQAAPTAYNPFDEFEEAVPSPKALAMSAPTEKIGAWSKVGRNEETDLNIYKNNKGTEIYRTSNAGVFGRGSNGSIGEWVGVMRPDGTINTDIEAPGE
jgi:hypothetical protein